MVTNYNKAFIKKKNYNKASLVIIENNGILIIIFREKRCYQNKRETKTYQR